MHVHVLHGSICMLTVQVTATRERCRNGLADTHCRLHRDKEQHVSVLRYLLAEGASATPVTKAAGATALHLALCLGLEVGCSLPHAHAAWRMAHVPVVWRMTYDACERTR